MQLTIRILASSDICCQGAQPYESSKQAKPQACASTSAGLPLEGLMLATGMRVLPGIAICTAGMSRQGAGGEGSAAGTARACGADGVLGLRRVGIVGQHRTEVALEQGAGHVQ